MPLCLPYVGELATNKFARQIRRLIAKIAPCVELRIVFRAAQKLSCLTRLKSKLNVLRVVLYTKFLVPNVKLSMLVKLNVD